MSLRRWVRALWLLPLLFAWPAGAALPGLTPVEVAPHTYFVQGLPEIGSSANQNFISNAGFVIGPAGVVVIDALGSPAIASRLIEQIRQRTDKPITHVILTHYHADHIYGLQSFKDAGAQIIAQEHAREYLNSDAAAQRLATSRIDIAPWIDDKTRLVPADIWISAEADLELAGLQVQIRQMGPAHTSDDLAIFFPESRALFAGDLVFRGRIPYVGNADSRGWIAALDRLLALDAAVVIPGHGAYSTDPREDIRFTRDYLRYLRDTMGPPARDLEDFDVAYQSVDWSRYRDVPLFGAANRMNAYNVYLSIQSEPQ
jgi:glyoxylase-like metal-dependent hydrolase (beta-lactamase superfamily II)